MTETAIGAAAATSQRLDDSRVWLLAAAPLLLLVVDAAFLYSGHSDGSAVSWVVAIGVNSGLAVWDERYLRSRGIRVSAALGALFVPGYLWQRSRRLDRSQALLAVWIAAFVVSVAGSTVLDSRFVTLNMPTVEQSIHQWLVKQGAATSVAVRCPSASVYGVHDTFICDVSAGGQSASVLVRVQDSRGAITWQVIGA